MKVYILTEESIHEECDETNADCKRIVGVYRKLVDAQAAMRLEASKVAVSPGFDDTQASSTYVETVKCRIQEERNSLGEDCQIITSDVTWRWSVDEYDIIDSSESTQTPNMK